MSTTPIRSTPAAVPAPAPAPKPAPAQVASVPADKVTISKPAGDPDHDGD